jgi:hypothetical protein
LVARRGERRAVLADGKRSGAEIALRRTDFLRTRGPGAVAGGSHRIEMRRRADRRAAAKRSAHHVSCKRLQDVGNRYAVMLSLAPPGPTTVTSAEPLPTGETALMLVLEFIVTKPKSLVLRDLPWVPAQNSGDRNGLSGFCRWYPRCPGNTWTRISLGEPILIFIYGLVLLLIRCVIGMQWYQPIPAPSGSFPLQHRISAILCCQ